MVMPKASWFGAQENSGKPAFGGREQSGTPAAVERTEGQGKLLLFAGLEGPGTDTEIKGKTGLPKSRPQSSLSLLSMVIWRPSRTEEVNS